MRETIVLLIVMYRTSPAVSEGVKVSPSLAAQRGKVVIFSKEQLKIACSPKKVVTFCGCSVNAAVGKIDQGEYK